MSYRAFTYRVSLLVAASFALTVLLACGGRDVPTHDGYRNARVKGWKKPQLLEFDEDFEAEADGELSYPKRRRSRWYAVELPADGEISVQLDVAPLGFALETEDIEDEEDPFDVAFEILDANHRVLARADRDEDDAGDRKRSRKAADLRKGQYLIHLYVQRRLDEAEYSVRVKFKGGQVDPETDFPTNVAFVDPLPVVPAFDDAPEPTRRARRRCKGKNCRKPRDKPKKDDKQPQTAATGTIKARIVGVRASGGGTVITINKGSKQGIVPKMRGKVVTQSGTAIEGGGFTITKVTGTKSTATVSASPDAVTAAKRVRIEGQ